MTDLDRMTTLRPEVSDPTPEWLAANRTALLEHAAAASTRRRGPRRGTLVALAAGIAVLAVVALVIPASTMLTARPHNQFVYVKQGFRDSKDQDQLTISEGWFAVDGGMPLPAPGGLCVMTTIGQCKRPGIGSLALPPEASSPATIIGWSYQQYLTLPTDRERLRGVLYDQARLAIAAGQKAPDVYFSTNLDEEAYILISGTMLKAAVPPEIAAAFFHVLPTIPGVTVDQNAKDAAGRPGVGFMRYDNAQPFDTTLVFSPGSKAFLGVNHQDRKWTDYVPSVAVLSYGLVDAVGDRL